MLALLLTLLTSSVACLVLIPIVRRLAVRCGLVDQPDGRRKVQARPVAMGGGIAILASAVLGVGAAAMIPGLPRDQLADWWPTALGIGLAAVVICGVGVMDDFRLIRGRHKLVGQILAVAIVIGCGVVVRKHQAVWLAMGVGPLALPFTAFLLLGAINSLNLLDGMDGMLGSVGAVICLAVAGMAALAGHWAVAGFAASLAGALIAFLRYNLPPGFNLPGRLRQYACGAGGRFACHRKLSQGAGNHCFVGAGCLAYTAHFRHGGRHHSPQAHRPVDLHDGSRAFASLFAASWLFYSARAVAGLFSAATGLGVLASEAFNNEWIALLTGIAVVGVLIPRVSSGSPRWC